MSICHRHSKPPNLYSRITAELLALRELILYFPPLAVSHLLSAYLIIKNTKNATKFPSSTKMKEFAMRFSRKDFASSTRKLFKSESPQSNPVSVESGVNLTSSIDYIQTVIVFLASSTASLSRRPFSARCSLLILSTIRILSQKRSASAPVRTGVSLIGLAMIIYICFYYANIQQFSQLFIFYKQNKYHSLNPILSTGSHEQDVRAMLELYDDLIERDEPQNDKETTLSDKENSETTQSDPQKRPRNHPERPRKL